MAPEWLSTRDQEWVRENLDLLETTWESYERSGEWRDPVEVLRRLRARTPSRLPNAALEEMPTALGRREYAPPQLILSIFGLGCCPQATTVLKQYLAVAHLALRRFDLPSLPNRLTRADVTAELGLSEEEADRLSDLLNRDAPFLGSGSTELKSWDREIDPRVEEFEGIKTLDALLAFLAGQRRIAEPPVVPMPVLTGPAREVEPVTAVPGPQSGDHPYSWTVLTGLATIAAAVFTILQSPAAVGVAVSGGLLAATVALLFKARLPLVLVFALAGAVAGGALAAVVTSGEQPPDSHRYFVNSTGETSVLIPRIEPHDSAAMEGNTVLGSGDLVAVRCIHQLPGDDWAQLTSGSFVPAVFLTVEVGGDGAPAC